MNKKGFTLVELLAVIVLLGLIVGIAVPTVTGIISSVKNNMLEKKLQIIEEAAILYGEDFKGSVISSSLKYDTYPCKGVKVSKLVEESYLEKDNDNNCITTDGVNTDGCIIDPSNTDNYLDNYEVIIYYKNRRIYAKVDKDNNLTCGNDDDINPGSWVYYGWNGNTTYKTFEEAQFRNVALRSNSNSAMYEITSTTNAVVEACLKENGVLVCSRYNDFNNSSYMNDFESKCVMAGGHMTKEDNTEGALKDYNCTFHDFSTCNLTEGYGNDFYASCGAVHTFCSIYDGSINCEGGPDSIKEVYTLNYEMDIEVESEIPGEITQYNSPSQAMEAWDTEYGDRFYYFLKHILQDDIVKESYIGFVVTPEMKAKNSGMKTGTYYLRNGESYYEANISTLETAFGTSNCHTVSNGDTYYECVSDSYQLEEARIKSDYSVVVGTSPYCIVGNVSGCYPV